MASEPMATADPSALPSIYTCPLPSRSMAHPTRCQLVSVILDELVTSVRSSLHRIWLEALNCILQPSLSASSLEIIYSVPVVVRFTQAKREKSTAASSKRKVDVSGMEILSSVPSKSKEALYFPV